MRVCPHSYPGLTPALEILTWASIQTAENTHRLRSVSSAKTRGKSSFFLRTTITSFQKTCNDSLIGCIFFSDDDPLRVMRHLTCWRHYVFIQSGISTFFLSSFCGRGVA